MTALAVSAVRSGWTRRVAGIAISAVFLVLTIMRVDLPSAGGALSRVAPLGLLAAIGLSALEVAIRAERWRRILQPFAPVDYRSSVAYLCIGYFANTLLPARLGDLARTVLAARAFGIPRIRTLATILLERVADGLTILAIVAVLVLVLPEARPLVTSAVSVATVVAVAMLVGAVLVVATHRTRMATTRLGVIAREIVARLVDGLEAIRTPSRFLAVLVLTIVPFGVAVVTLLTVAAALGVGLTIPQAILAMGALALSTAIPAAPGSLGTYEFVGLATLTGIGVAPEQAIAIVVLVHLIATLPPAIAGLALTSILHLNVVGLGRALGQEPAAQ
jgi:uncharacterized protein (TIRG00374 family)